jgi:HNH endonuclease
MKLIPLTNSGYTKVDDEDYEKYYRMSWYENSRGYAINRNKPKDIFLHRLILENKLGRKLLPFPQEFCDHKDCNKLNNQRDNLRLTNYSKNALNSKRFDGNTHTGVDKLDNRYKTNNYRAQIKINGKTITACFKTEAEAIKWRNEKVKSHETS